MNYIKLTALSEIDSNYDFILTEFITAKDRTQAIDLSIKQITSETLYGLNGEYHDYVITSVADLESLFADYGYVLEIDFYYIDEI